MASFGIAQGGDRIELRGAVGRVRAEEYADHMDILIRVEGTPAIVVEVKRDRGLSCKSLEYVKQAYGYSMDVGFPFVMITNGDTCVLYSKRNGYSYDENLVGQFTLTKLRDNDSRKQIDCLLSPRRQTLVTLL